MTTAEVEEVLHGVLAEEVGAPIQVVMKALNKRGTTRLEGIVASVHRHGFVVGERSRRVFVTFSDLFCQAAQVVGGSPKERLAAALSDLRGRGGTLPAQAS
ncbi:MAG: hypothetical protein K6V73_11795 [Firmicutes bacterium]|nr:hypothetical protein [Bacillota bacterium]